MKSRNALISSVLLFAVVLAACSGSLTQETMMEMPDDEMMEATSVPMLEDKNDADMAEPTHDAVMDDAMTTPDAMLDEAPDMMETPAWFSATMTDARSGRTFSINDFKGKVVLVETMAIWCSNCLRQQGQVKALHEQLGAREDFVSIGLDIDPNENTAALKSFVENQGFDWFYAVPSVDISREIASLYGAQFLNPPSTPMVVIDRHGDAHPLPFGIKSADELMQAIQPFLDEGI